MIRRLICRFKGHVDGGRCEMLPEDGWGMYAVSKCYCARCGQVSWAPYPWEELARFNSERSHGIVHEPEFVARMAIQQDYFNDLTRRGLL